MVTGLPLSSGPESGSRVGPTHSLNEQPSKSSSAQPQHRLEPQTGRSIITFFEMSWMIDRRQTQTTDRQQSDMQVLVSSINGVTLGNGCFQTAQLSISIIMGPGLLLSACLGNHQKLGRCAQAKAPFSYRCPNRSAMTTSPSVRRTHCCLAWCKYECSPTGNARSCSRT